MYTETQNKLLYLFINLRKQMFMNHNLQLKPDFIRLQKHNEIELTCVLFCRITGNKSAYNQQIFKVEYRCSSNSLYKFLEAKF